VSAFGEAFNNIALHSYRAGPPGDVDIEIESEEDRIVIRLMDTGTSFDPASVTPPDMEDLPESGMGLFIMHSFMDEVDYRPGSPNVLRLAKRRDARSHLSGDGGEGERDVGDEFADPLSDHRTSGHSGIRMRSVARTSQERAAGGIKIQ
jgi:serine/threonine-protein kinase RsbW